MKVKGWWIPPSQAIPRKTEVKKPKPKVKSTFGRQKIVENGLVENVCSSVSLSASDGRVWIGSSVKSCSGVVEGASVVAFERGSILEGIWDSAFRGSGLRSIFVPSSVVVLGKASFFRCESLQLVTFESGSRLERIEESAFSRSGLKLIEIPASVVVLGHGSFCECESLDSVTFESGSRLERIEGMAFFESGLRSIEIPGGVTSLGVSACRGRHLTSISVSQDNVRFRVRERCLEAFDGSKIYHYFGRCRSIVIPSSVVVLGQRCFYMCESLVSVTFESGSRLERIEHCAFAFSGLKSILIPSSVVLLGNSCFSECKSLYSMTFESGSRLERIEDFAFHAIRVKSIKIPGGVTFLDGSAFDVRRLNSVSVSPDNMQFRVRELCLEDFDGSKIYRCFGSRRSIVIPSSVVVLGKCSFYKCKSLESVTFESGSRLERIEEHAFSESGLKSIVIPSSVTVLGKYSFLRCKSLHSVTFESGSRLERIEDLALHGTLLKSIVIPSSVVFSDKRNHRSSSSSEMQIIFF